ncbi:MAG: dihydropyrimidinase [Chloroflexota bacterium]
MRAAPRFTRLIRGGTVVTAAGSFRADVALDGERIAAVEAGIPVETAADVVEATGLLVLPGIVDVHTHTRIPSDAEPDRFFQDTVAAAFGGTTSLLAFDNPGTGISEAAQRRLRDGVLEWRDRTRGDAAIDVGVSAVLTAQQEDPVADLAWLVDQGVPSVKCFLVYDFGIGEAQLAAVLREGARTGALIQVHGEDRAMLDAGIAAQLAAGETGARGHQRSRPPAVEAAGTATAIRLARDAGARVYLVHVSSGAALDEIAAARAAGAPVFAETCPHYLTLDSRRYAQPEPEAIKAVISPPLREPADRDAMWAGLASGSLDLVATDHVPDRLAVEKVADGRPFPVVSNGAPGVETLLSVVWDGAVAGGRLTPERVVDALSTTPARLFGLPRKGAVEAGRDADLVLFDPAARRTIRAEALHHTSDFTPYEGMEVAGAVRRVISRGADVVVEGRFVGRRGAGTDLWRVAER